MSAPCNRRKVDSSHAIVRFNRCLFLQRLETLFCLLLFVWVVIVSGRKKLLVVLDRFLGLMQMIQRGGAEKQCGGTVVQRLRPMTQRRQHQRILPISPGGEGKPAPRILLCRLNL